MAITCWRSRNVLILLRTRYSVRILQGGKTFWFSKFWMISSRECLPWWMAEYLEEYISCFQFPGASRGSLELVVPADTVVINDPTYYTFLWLFAIFELADAKECVIITALCFSGEKLVDINSLHFAKVGVTTTGVPCSNLGVWSLVSVVGPVLHFRFSLRGLPFPKFYSIPSFPLIQFNLSKNVCINNNFLNHFINRIVSWMKKRISWMSFLNRL